MSGTSLSIGSQVFDLDALADSTPRQAATENERDALAFCRDWLSGVATFTVNTSGSTGAPKAIELSRAQMEASARATAAALDLRAGMTALVCLPTRYIAGQMMLVRGLVLGLKMFLVEPAANPLVALAGNVPIDFAAFVPLQMETLLTSPERARVDSMHAVLVGGGPVSGSLAAAVAPLRAPVYHTYGMTETATHVALRPLSGARRSSAFRPLPGVELQLDARGCLAVRGPMTSGDWVQTNDLVALNPDGTFLWLGRADNVINSGGVKVQVEPLEAVLEYLLPEILGTAWNGQRFAVAGSTDDRLGSQVTLILEGRPLPPEAQAMLLAQLRERLGPFETPRACLYADKFVLTSTGKIDRTATLALAQ